MVGSGKDLPDEAQYNYWVNDWIFVAPSAIAHTFGSLARHRRRACGPKYRTRCHRPTIAPPSRHLLAFSYAQPTALESLAVPCCSTPPTFVTVYRDALTNVRIRLPWMHFYWAAHVHHALEAAAGVRALPLRAYVDVWLPRQGDSRMCRTNGSVAALLPPRPEPVWNGFQHALCPPHEHGRIVCRWTSPRCMADTPNGPETAAVPRTASVPSHRLPSSSLSQGRSPVYAPLEKNTVGIDEDNFAP